MATDDNLGSGRMSNGNIDNFALRLRLLHSGFGYSHLFSRGFDGVVLTLAIILIRSTRVSSSAISALLRLI